MSLVACLLAVQTSGVLDVLFGSCVFLFLLSCEIYLLKCVLFRYFMDFCWCWKHFLCVRGQRPDRLGSILLVRGRTMFTEVSGWYWTSQLERKVGSGSVAHEEKPLHL